MVSVTVAVAVLVSMLGMGPVGPPAMWLATQTASVAANRLCLSET